MSTESTNPTVGQSGEEYVVVARRYRPQTFEELIGQGHVAKSLSQAINTGRVGHAYLFTGARGVGKTSAARILAKALNCETGPTPTPCNKCDLCQSVSSGDDVDVLEIDGASNRGIDEIRQLRQNVAVRPSRSRFKIYIIDEVHMLTKEAFNALLKTLEEPPEHVKFIFATTEPNKIPITILSRCQRFDFAGIEAGSIEARLAQIAQAEGVEIEAEALQTLAVRAAGSMRDSQSLLEQLLAVAGERITGDEVNSLLGIAPAQRVGALAARLADRDASGALAELDAALAGGADVGQIIDQLLGYFRDVMTQTVGCGAERLIYALPAQAEQLTQLAERLGVQTVLAMLQVLDQTAARLRVSVHSRTLAEMAVVRIASLGDLDDLAGLVASVRDGSPLPQGGGAQPGAAPQRSNATQSSNAATATKPAPQASQAPPVPSSPPRASQASSSAGLAGALKQQLSTQPPANSESPNAASPAITVRAENQEAATIGEEENVLTAQDAERIWQSAVGEVGGILSGTASMATEVTVAQNNRLLVRFDQPTHMEFCEKPTSRTELEEAIARSAGRKVPLQFEVVAGSGGVQQARPPRQSRRQLLAEASEHPFVKQAMELFDVQPDKLRYTPPES